MGAFKWINMSLLLTLMLQSKGKDRNKTEILPLIDTGMFFFICITSAVSYYMTVFNMLYLINSKS